LIRPIRGNNENASNLNSYKVDNISSKLSTKIHTKITNTNIGEHNKEEIQTTPKKTKTGVFSRL